MVEFKELREENEYVMKVLLNNRPIKARLSSHRFSYFATQFAL